MTVPRPGERLAEQPANRPVGHPVERPTKPPGRRPGKKAVWGACAVLAGVLLAGLAASVLLGSVTVSADTVARIVARHLTGQGEPTWSVSQDTVVWNLRLPRALLAALVGAGLAVSGAATQA
ncbi:iron chelate uptake ABC transporter family permease subunit, partial [Streptosporangium saharense]|uniref:iron chelate uptake ABC transporter family permease subunit n=1 Tax=Streptosporangium saharense TaxID=1706840 RepID=UPI00332E739F